MEKTEKIRVFSCLWVLFLLMVSPQYELNDPFLDQREEQSFWLMSNFINVAIPVRETEHLSEDLLTFQVTYERDEK